jgi:hypothetical protein
MERISWTKRGFIQRFPSDRSARFDAGIESLGRSYRGHLWLTTAPPLIEMPNWENAAEPYPLTWDEQNKLFKALPDHLAKMALFAVNTGLRKQRYLLVKVAQWELKIPELGISVCVIPAKPREYSDGV